ncbi:putative mucin-like protein [Phytophthora sojae]|uniref:Mucin-like protein n=1 Tax=Phytophthora sojae (strain P6497) TaxID=1094619 RepID=G5A0H9_PHYSP|nr:putative mucin-like protein [Phytophthora sojae]EGZ11368.1 putative mucin-like protein [Phytophthora sojae]|eukprot:XP_009534113.1 putative mucin-like protein [Phytophthora sojae]
MKISAIATFSVTALLVVAAAEEGSATPYPTTATTMTTPVYDDDLGCWAISVEHDATYCINGPICSGSGASPAGTLCPVKGDVAIADCHSYLASYSSDDSCVLPVDATCQVIKTGAWGCVLSGSATPAPTTTSTCDDGSCEEEATPAPTKTCDGDCEETIATPCPTATTTTVPTSTPTTTATPCPTSTKVPTPTATVTLCPEPTTKPCPTCTEAPTATPTSPPTPTPTACTGNCTHSGSGSFSGNGSYVGNNTIKAETTESTSSSSGVSAGVIGAIAAAAAVVAVVAGAAIYKQYNKKLDEEAALEHYHVDVVTP